jgi:hypothetical protein
MANGDIMCTKCGQWGHNCPGSKEISWTISDPFRVLKLQASIKEFCDKEYGQSIIISERNREFILNPVDGGGYDATGEVSMTFEGDEAILTFDGNWDKYFPLKHAVYRFKLI